MLIFSNVKKIDTLTIQGLGGRFGRFPLCKYLKRQQNPFSSGRRPYRLKNPLLNSCLKTCFEDDGNKYFIVIEYKEFEFDETNV